MLLGSNRFGPDGIVLTNEEAGMARKPEKKTNKSTMIGTVNTEVQNDDQVLPYTKI